MWWALSLYHPLAVVQNFAEPFFWMLRKFIGKLCFWCLQTGNFIHPVAVGSTDPEVQHWFVAAKWFAIHIRWKNPSATSLGQKRQGRYAYKHRKTEWKGEQIMYIDGIYEFLQDQQSPRFYSESWSDKSEKWQVHHEEWGAFWLWLHALTYSVWDLTYLHVDRDH